MQLHVVEELLELFGMDIVFDSPPVQLPDNSEDTVFAISRQALDGTSAPKAVQLHAWLQGQEVLMLIDSGSTMPFVNRSLVGKLQGIVPYLVLVV